MPGSKTYTSSKVNELIELEIFDGLQQLERQRLKGLSFTIFLEVIKISLSMLVTTLLNVPSATEKDTFVFDLKVITIGICLFVVIYVIINLLVMVGKWIYDAIWNKRRLLKEKKQAHVCFHKKIVNYIYIAISFENKYISYLARTDGVADNLNIDLGINYLSQAEHYFNMSKNELENLVPPRGIKRKGRERKNAEFLDYIGYPTLNISLISAHRSIDRLIDSQEKMNELIAGINEERNGAVIQAGYSNAVEAIYKDLDLYRAVFGSLLERVDTLKKLLQ